MMIFRVLSLSLLGASAVLTVFVPRPVLTNRQRVVFLLLILSAACGAALAMFGP